MCRRRARSHTPSTMQCTMFVMVINQDPHTQRRRASTQSSHPPTQPTYAHVGRQFGGRLPRDEDVIFSSGGFAFYWSCVGLCNHKHAPVLIRAEWAHWTPQMFNKTADFPVIVDLHDTNYLFAIPKLVEIGVNALLDTHGW